MPDLSTKQIELANLLASGVTQLEAAKVSGVSRSTVSRYWKDESFKAEVERRRAQAIAQHQQQADELQRSEINQFYSDLKEYRQARIQAYRSKISRGVKLLQKVGRRFDDLPEEAIQPQQMASLFSVADEMVEKGFQGWAEILALDKLLEQMDGSQDRS